MRLLYIALLLSALSFGQDRNGISYQALILNPQGEQLPGANNNTVPMANTEVCLRFHITTNAGSYNEYSERQVLTTDAYGMINTVVGTGAPVGTIMWNQIVWTEDSKGLKVEIDYSGECSSFVALSSQELTSVPFALYSPASNIPGPPGEAGDSAYQVWIDEGNTGTEQEFLDSLKGTDGEPGDPGADGDSAYQLWIDEGNTGTEQEFLDSLKGTDGDPGEGTEGKSAYEVWIELGNTGTEQDFIDSLSGPKGDPGLDGVKSLIKTSLEESGSNCINGGVKIEVGEDTNADGILDTVEVDDSLTRYVCNGADGEDGGSSGGSSSFFNNIEALDAIVPVDSCSTQGDPQGYIAPAGSAWTTSQAIGFNYCYQTPNGIWRDGGCSGTLYYPNPPAICGIDISSPIPSQIEHLYPDLDSSKIEITLPEGNQCFEIIMRVEFIDNNGQAIPSFVEHKFVTSSVSYIKTDYISSNVTQDFNLSSINPYNSGYLLNKLVFNLPNNASILKVTFIAPTPDFISNINPCNEDSYSTVYQTYYSNGIRSPSLAWLDGNLFYEINKWQ